jgi:integrase
MLTAKKVERTKTPGRYRCGLVRGLYLQISDNGAKSYVLRFERHGRERMMGLGSASEFSLKEARGRARAARQLLADGVDPLDQKHADRAAAKLAAARKLAFRDAARRYFDQNEKGWRSASHRDEFLRSLEAYAYPVIGGMDVAVIGIADILRILEPIWTSKTTTADRVRARIAAVLDWCVVRGHRPPGTNPAAWKDHLDQVLPPVRRVAPVAPHPAMDYRRVPEFVTKLNLLSGVAAKALQFTIITAARAGEVVNATWDEIDIDDSRTWVIPGHKMKGGREHRVSLSDVCIDLLNALPREAGNPHVFIGARSGAALSKMAMTDVMTRLGQRGVTTIHGFRSSFSNWAHEQTAHSAHTIEISLAHRVGNETERAYRRTDMVAKRSQLMQAWSRFCMSPPTPERKRGSNIVSMRESA